MKIQFKPHQKFLLKRSVLRCGVMAPVIGSAINMLLFRPGRTVAYLGVEVFFTALITSLICNLIYCRNFKKEKALNAPEMPYDLKTHILYKYMPSGGVFKQSLFLAIVTTVLIAVLPALMLIITGMNTEATLFGWVGCKMLTGIVYVSFTTYHIMAYRITSFQKADRGE